MRIVIFIFNFKISFIVMGTSKSGNEAHCLYDTQDSDIFTQTKILNNIEIKNNFNHSSSSFLHTYPENDEKWKQNFLKLNNDHEQVRSEFIYSDSTIINMAEQPKYIPDHNIGSVHIDQEIDNGFLAYEKYPAYNNTTSDINRKTFQFDDTNMDDVRICKSNNSEVYRNSHYNQNIDINRTGKNKQESTRLSSFDTLKNYLNFVRSDNIPYAAKDVDIEPQSFNTEISFHDTLKYGQDSIVKESSTNYDNLENIEAIHLLPQELAYHNKIIYDQNAFTKKNIYSEINSVNNEYTQLCTFNTFNDEVMHHTRNSIDPNSNIDLENVEETGPKQWKFNTYSDSNTDKNNIYANYGNNTNFYYPSTFSDHDTIENSYISQNNSTSSETHFNSENQISLSDHNCARYRDDIKNTYLTDLNTKNESNFNIENQSSSFNSNAYQALINDNYLIHSNDNFQKTNLVDLQNEFYARENSEYNTAEQQNDLHQTDNTYFLNNLTSYEYNSLLPRHSSEKQTNNEEYIKILLLSENKKKENQLHIGNDIRISKNKQSILCENNDEQEIKIISNNILESKNSYLVSQEPKSKNDLFIHTDSILNKKRKIKHIDEDKATDKYSYFENYSLSDKTFIKKHIENIFHNKNNSFYMKKRSENSKIEFFYNKPSYNAMIDYLLSNIEEYLNLENQTEENFKTNIILSWSSFSIVIDLIKKILVIEGNNFFKAQYEDIKMVKYRLNQHFLTKSFFNSMKRILLVFSSLKIFKLWLPEFSLYNEEYNLESCFKKENDIELDNLQTKYFITLVKFVEKIHTNNTGYLEFQKLNILTNVRYIIRKFTFLALQPFFNCNFKKIYNNLIVKGMRLSNGIKMNNEFQYNIIKAMRDFHYITYSKFSYYIRFLFLYIDFQEIFEHNFNIFVHGKNFDKNYLYYPKNTNKKFYEKMLLFNCLADENLKYFDYIHKIKTGKKYWIPYNKILLIYFDKINNMDFRDEKIKYKIKLIKDKILEFFTSYSGKMEELGFKKKSYTRKYFLKKNLCKKSIRNKEENDKKNERNNINYIFSESRKIILEIEGLEDLELQKVDNILQ